MNTGEILIYEAPNGNIMVCRKFRHTTQHGAIEGKMQDVSLKEIEEDIKRLNNEESNQ